MAALSAARNTLARDARLLSFRRANSVTLYPGGIACLNSSGLVTPGAAATTLKALGRTVREFTHSDGNVWVDVERGCFKFGNSASGDAITNAHYGQSVYVVDDQTVALTDGSSARSVAGICRGVDSDGVWVEF
jgi:hypothetical protein